MKRILWTLLAVALLIGLGVWVYYNAGSRLNTEIDEEKLYDLELSEREILKGIKTDRKEFDNLVRDFQLTPKTLIDLNYMIMKLSYEMNDKEKLAISDEDLKLLGSVQRMYYDDELLAINTEEEFYENLLESIRKANEAKTFIIDHKVKEPILELDGEAVVDVSYILNGTNVDDILYQQYLLRKKDGLWYIVGWRGINKEEYERNK